MASSLFRAASFLHSTRILPKTLYGSSAFLRQISTYLPLTEEEVVSISLDVIQACPPDIKSPKKASDFVFVHPKIKIKRYPYVDRFRVVTRVLDGCCAFPQIDHVELFGMRCIIRSMLYLPENVKDLTREQVTSRVLEIVTLLLPNVDSSKVNENTHFEKDLGLDYVGRNDILIGLNWMFRIHDIPAKLLVSEFKTVKQTVDYICSRLHETWEPNQDSGMSVHQDYIEHFRPKEYDIFIIQQKE